MSELHEVGTIGPGLRRRRGRFLGEEGIRLGLAAAAGVAIVITLGIAITLISSGRLHANADAYLFGRSIVPVHAGAPQRQGHSAFIRAVCGTSRRMP